MGSVGDGSDWITAAEAARAAGVRPTKLERLIRAGIVTPTRIGPARYVRPETVDVLRAHAADRRGRPPA